MVEKAATKSKSLIQELDWCDQGTRKDVFQPRQTLYYVISYFSCGASHYSQDKQLGFLGAQRDVG